MLHIKTCFFTGAVKYNLPPSRYDFIYILLRCKASFKSLTQNTSAVVNLQLILSTKIEFDSIVICICFP